MSSAQPFLTPKLVILRLKLSGLLQCMPIADLTNTIYTITSPQMTSRKYFYLQLTNDVMQVGARIEICLDFQWLNLFGF